MALYGLRATYRYLWLSTAYAIENLQARSTLFIRPTDPIYSGQIVGENSRAEDMPCNPTKKKHLTNMRNSIRDIDVRLTPPRQMSLDECIEYLGADELLEVTPQSLRIRKRVLKNDERLKDQRRREKLAATG